MKIVIFGLTISSSWGNGHATLWRALCRSLATRGHQVVFFERDVPYYAAHRDFREVPGGRLHLYMEWQQAVPTARRELADADVALVTSYCPDGIAATRVVLDSPAQVRCFYDLDTPVTLGNLRAGRRLAYLDPETLPEFDLVLSFTGGQALRELTDVYGARQVAPLYGSVDPDVHHAVAPQPHYRADLSYLGTYAEDRQQALQELFINPARQRPDLRFVLGGAQYPQEFPWTSNIYFVRHLPPCEHPAFYSSSRITLNITRRAMASMGYCPQGRLFEAAACGTAIISDAWEGLETFFRPDSEIIVARHQDDALRALDMSDAQLQTIGEAARQRTLDEHTADRRASEMERLLEQALAGDVRRVVRQPSQERVI